MKKLFSILLVCTMLFALATSVSASKTGALKGEIPKLPAGVEIVVDGTLDEAYTHGFSTTIYRLDVKYKEDTGTRGQVWLLWNDTTLYAFAQVKDADVIPTTPDMQEQSSWISDSFEIFLDIGNDQSIPIHQYRTDFQGFNTHYVDDESISVRGSNDDVGEYFTSAAKWVSDGYSVELAIDLTRFGNDIEENLEIGIQLLVNDMTSAKASERSAIFYTPSLNNAKDWAKDSYDYVLLGGEYDPNAELTGPAETEPETTEAPETEPIVTEPEETEPEETEPEETEPEETEEETEEEEEDTKANVAAPVVEDEASFPVVPVVIAAVVLVAVIVVVIVLAKKKKN